MANITTTVAYNAKTGKYDVSPTTPFNITCFYENSDFSYTYGEVSKFLLAIFLLILMPLLFLCKFLYIICFICR